jgi:hypothetical protein
MDVKKVGREVRVGEPDSARLGFLALNKGAVDGSPAKE